MAFQSTIDDFERRIDESGSDVCELGEMLEYYTTYQTDGWIDVNDDGCDEECSGWDGRIGGRCECGNNAWTYQAEWYKETVVPWYGTEEVTYDRCRIYIEKCA